MTDTKTPTDDTQTGLIARQLVRVTKMNSLIGALDKDIERAPAGDGTEDGATWGDKAREAASQMGAWLESLTAALNEAPDGYEHPAKPRGELARAKATIEVGSSVQIKEKYREQYKRHLDGIEFGTTAVGTVISKFEDNPKKTEATVEFRSGEKAVRVVFALRRLATVKDKSAGVAVVTDENDVPSTLAPS